MFHYVHSIILQTHVFDYITGTWIRTHMSIKYCISWTDDFFKNNVFAAQVSLQGLISKNLVKS